MAVFLCLTISVPVIANTIQGGLVGTAPPVIDNGKWNAYGITCVLPSGKLAIVYREGISHASVGDVGIIRIRTSIDSGNTWSEAITIQSDDTYDLRNVTGGVSPDGRLVVAIIRYDPGATSYSGFIDARYIYSEDEGETWSDPAILSEPEGASNWYDFHGAMIAIGDGLVLLPAYGDDGTNYSEYVLRSSDGGKTWDEPVTVATSTTLQWDEASHVYLGNGTIVGLCRIHNDTTLRQVLSYDNGLTWTDQGYVLFDSWLSIDSAPPG